MKTRLKNSNKILLALFALLLLCEIVAVADIGLKIRKFTNSDAGSSPSIENPISKDLPDFHSIDVSAPFHLSLKHSDKSQILFLKDDNTSDSIKTVVENGILYVKGTYQGRLETSAIEIYTPDIRKVIITGSASINLRSFALDSLCIDLKNGASIYCNDLNVDYLSLKAQDGAQFSVYKGSIGHLSTSLANRVNADLGDTDISYLSGELKDRSQLYLKGGVDSISARIDKRAKLNKY
ncbi:DUF2807 domain-containing protein [Fulvivirgaceae bacterium BMA10]|uniref:DUF2807 domain-containing protein n=1 Tax=Splendidivirga corallicola TaxID=3051826 RepID=A0ABT8KNN8_9BACT|nr:DUF2807 domain-containing protein [Fulvivirgaceae bacterium BMA10]